MKIDKDTFYKEYIENNLTIKEIANKYETTVDAVKSLNKKKFKIHKQQKDITESRKRTIIREHGVENITQADSIKDKLKKHIDKNELIDYYITNHHTQLECAAHFGISVSTLVKILKEYDLLKPQNVLNNEREIQINKDELYNFYIIENHSLRECSKKFNLSISYLYKKTHEYGMIKDKDTVQQNTTNTLLKNYGVGHPLQNLEIQNKWKETCQQKYSADNPLASQDIKNKILNTNRGNNNCDYPQQINIKHYEEYYPDERFIEYIKSHTKRRVAEIAAYFNVIESTICKKIHKLNLDDYVDLKPQRSYYEDEIVGIIYSFGIKNIELNTRSYLDGQEIDIYLPDYKVGIEFNGNYWHSELRPKFQDHNGRSLYHQEKSLLAESKGIFLFHIFEYEWTNLEIKTKIISRLKNILHINATQIYARKCEVRKLTRNEKMEFLNKNHVQGNDHCAISYGLVYNSEIVACMCFIKSKYKKYDWELSRFCDKSGTVVVGGASKLFKYFLNTINPGETVVSYSDITKTTGNLYNVLGFKCMSVNSPNYIWYNFDTRDIRSRYQEQKAGEIKRMHDQEYYRICDCGTKTWLYKK